MTINNVSLCSPLMAAGSPSLLPQLEGSFFNLSMTYEALSLGWLFLCRLDLKRKSSDNIYFTQQTYPKLSLQSQPLQWGVSHWLAQNPFLSINLTIIPSQKVKVWRKIYMLDHPVLLPKTSITRGTALALLSSLHNHPSSSLDWTSLVLPPKLPKLRLKNSLKDYIFWHNSDFFQSFGNKFI